MGKPDQPRGPDGRWIPRSGGAFVAAIVLALALAPGTGSTGASVSGGSAGGTVRPQGSAKSHAKAQERNPARVLTRLERQGLQVKQRHTSADGDCAAHSYGLVREFFQENPCSALFRTYFEVQDRRRGVVLVAVSWVDMPGPRQAREFKQLVDDHGTGNVTELSREIGQYQDVRYTGKHYTSALQDTTVINAQAEPVSRSERTVALAERALDAALTP